MQGGGTGQGQEYKAEEEAGRKPWVSPEWSSFTREDMVLVMESAATSKSLRRFLLVPCAKASWTSPPTPLSESCGPWVGVEPADVERTGMGIGRPPPWVGDVCGDPVA